LVDPDIGGDQESGGESEAPCDDASSLGCLEIPVERLSPEIVGTVAGSSG
jgi:hypothetical protein